MIPWWVWGALYVAGAAVFVAWLLRELPRNHTLRGRIEKLCEIWDGGFGWLVPVRVSGYGLFAGLILLWLPVVVLMAVHDVPGHGKNIDPPSGDQ
ncbi:hypothetical protein C1I98_11210 [Spongiactinospora gelatinilytica]|uniref:Uncharacterized protein n=1 Tax=Spongiactinospora gelatinilytica TaxID=2666298 RepID=A0A2W2GK19_9ACTN|nr:hypothetical protein [Spongiactinospora gelatinilytica]PZG49876.1 hypothetical protein C1I98_11210 [Spongiactinospora gelatinilytica]